MNRGQDRMAAIDWEGVERDLDDHGWSLVPCFAAAEACIELADLYDDDRLFRKRVIMRDHGFGSGEYKYFDTPLPSAVQALRTELYPGLVPIANRWWAALGRDLSFPPSHADFLARCHAAGQTRSTPLLLHYGVGDYNRLHQDLYGDHVFPIQAAILLSEPGRDFEGGEFVMTEQRARMQARPMVVPLRRGDMVLFGVHERPVAGAQRMVRTSLRHGVSALRSGTRRTLGIIFHDAS